jgi:hypothetical protein
MLENISDYLSIAVTAVAAVLGLFLLIRSSLRSRPSESESRKRFRRFYDSLDDDQEDE